MPHFTLYDPLWYCSIIRRKAYNTPPRLTSDSHAVYRRWYLYTEQFGYLPGSQKEFLINRARYQMEVISSFCAEVMYYWSMHWFCWEDNSKKVQKKRFPFQKKHVRSSIPFERMPAESNMNNEIYDSGMWPDNSSSPNSIPLSANITQQFDRNSSIYSSRSNASLARTKILSQASRTSYKFPKARRKGNSKYNQSSSKKSCCGCFSFLKRKRTIYTDFDKCRDNIHAYMRRTIRIKNLDPLLILLALFQVSVFIKVYRDSEEWCISSNNSSRQVLKRSPSESKPTLNNEKRSMYLYETVHKLKNGDLRLDVHKLPSWCSLKILFLASLVISCKLYDPDLPKDNMTFYQTFHLQEYISLSDFNDAELFMIAILDFNMMVSMEEFAAFLTGYAHITAPYIDSNVFEPEIALTSSSVQELNWTK